MTDSRDPRLDVERLIALHRVEAVVASPDGRWLALAVARLDTDAAKYVRDLWRVDLPGSDGDLREPVQLTRGPSDDRAPCFRSDGGLGFLSNRNPRDGKPEEGDEDRAQVWLLPADAGEPRPLTDEPLGVELFSFARAADRLIVVAPSLADVPRGEQREHVAKRKEHGPSALHYREMPVRFWDHWLAIERPHLVAYDGDGQTRRDLTPAADREYRELQFDLASDGSGLVATSRSEGPDRIPDLALVWIDLESSELRVLDAGARTTVAHPRIAPDSRSLVYMRHTRSDERWGAPTLWRLDLASGQKHELAPTWQTHAVLHGWTSDGKAVVATADQRGHVPIFRVDAADGRVEQLCDTPGSHGDLSVLPGDAGVIGLRHRLCHPPEPFHMLLESGATPRLLARLSGYDETEGEQLASWDSFSIAGAGGEPVQFFLVSPREPATPDPLPALVWIHGGPAGQWADGWHWRWNPLVPVTAGYAVVLPNPRGSTGFGQDFVEGVWGNRWGAESYEDVMAVVESVAARPQIDGNRFVAMGGSYGGYMTNWIGANTDRFRCLITHASLFALSAFHGVTDSPAFWSLMMGMSPWQDDAAYDRYSPHRGIGSWKTPTLVIHGERDYRVPISEALALFEALQAHSVDSELLVFPDENHWILKPRNIRIWYDRWLEFASRHL